MKIVIRAGGVGTRLWPLSRQANPKQFQKVVGSQTMLSATYRRLKNLVEPEEIFVSVNRALADKLKTELPDLAADNIILETEARNTGPAICLETVWLKRFCAPEEIIASLPSDDYISDEAAFFDLLKLSADFIKTNPDHILTPAVRPTVADSGYSYFKVGAALAELGEEAIYEVAAVAEKPDEALCRELIASGDYYCHTGMYLWRLGLIDKLFAELQPELYAICSQVVAAMAAGDLAKAAELYAGAAKMTIESAITHRAPRVAMSVSDRIGWSDLGKWHIIKRMLSGEGANLFKGKVEANDVNNCLIYNNSDKKIIVANDLQDLVVVDTDDALFISSLTNSADVKKCLDKLKEGGGEEYL
jgi:mannose-1-phosphate guanylyltransferase